MLNPFSKNGRQSRPLPAASGKVFHVVPTSSALLADLEQLYPVDEDGVKRVWSGDTAIADALAFCVTGRGDRIRAHGGTYTISAPIAVSINDVVIEGLGSPGAASLVASASNIFTLTGDNIEIANLSLTIATTKIGIVMTGAENCNIHDNVFKSAVGGAASHFIQMVTTACSYNWIHDNRFLSMLDVSGGAITQTSHITGLGIGNIIEHNFFVAGRLTTANAGVVTSGIIFGAAADAGNFVRANSFTEFNGATFTAGTDYGTTALGGSVLCIENNYMLATAANAVVNGSNAGSFANNIASGTV